MTLENVAIAYVTNGAGRISTRKMLFIIGVRLARVPTARLFLAIGILLLGAVEAVPTRAQGCVGDCNGDGAVAINELILGVNIALGTAALTECSGFDGDNNQTISINELIAAVGFALGGCGFQPLEGVLLQGDPDRPAVDATVDMAPIAVDESEIQDGVIMTRLDLHLVPGATVGQVNAALELANAGVVSMLHGLPALTIAIPRPEDLDALSNVVQRLRAAPGIAWTGIAHTADPKALPPSPAGDNLDQLLHLLPTRYPAAWNASRLATADCLAHTVVVLVSDYFRPAPDPGRGRRFR